MFSNSLPYCRISIIALPTLGACRNVMSMSVHLYSTSTSISQKHDEACGAARPKQAAAVESSACGRVSAVGLTSILHR